MRKTKMWLLLSALCLVLPALSSSAHADAQPGDFAPTLTAKDFDGYNFDMAALKGKIVILDYWATWCAACRQELPELGAFNASHHGNDAVVLAISVDNPKNKQQVMDVAKAFRIPAVMFGDIKDGGWGTPPLIPTTFIIDTNGIVQARLVPEVMPITNALLEDYVKQLMPPPPSPKDKAKDAVKDDAAAKTNVNAPAVPEKPAK